MQVNNMWTGPAAYVNMEQRQRWWWWRI